MKPSSRFTYSRWFADTTAAAADLLDLIVLSAPLASLAVFLLQRLEPLDRVRRQVLQVMLHELDPLLDPLDRLVCLETVVGRDALMRISVRPDDVVIRHCAP